MYVLDEEGVREYREFFEGVSSEWSLAASRKLTPWRFTPRAFERPESGFRPEDLARASRMLIDPPLYQIEKSLHAEPVFDRFGYVRARWWTRRLARSHGIQLVHELLRARKAHSVLRRMFGRRIRKRHGFNLEQADLDPHLLGLVGPGKRPSDAWRDLSRAVVRLVAFRQVYLTYPFGAFALGFASLTECGDTFFPQLAKALKTKGDRVREGRIDGERLALCYRVAEESERVFGQATYPSLRRLIAKVIENFEFLKHRRRRVSRDSIYAWLRRNGW